MATPVLNTVVAAPVTVNEGTMSFSLTLTFDQQMLTSFTPTVYWLETENAAPALQQSGGTWSVNNTVYTATFTLTDADLDIANVDVGVTGARNVFNQMMTDTVKANIFSIDQLLATPGAPDLQVTSDSGSSDTDNLTNVQTPTLSVAVPMSGLKAGDTIQLIDTSSSNAVIGTHPVTAADIAAGTVAIATTTSLTTGVHNIAAQFTDPAGNSHTGTTLAVTIDITPPDAPSTPDLIAGSDKGASNTDNITNLATPTFTGMAETGATVTLYDGSNSIGSAVAGSDGTWSITTSTLGEGDHTIKAEATDVAGNTGDASNGQMVTIDATKPVVQSIVANDQLLTDADVGTDTFTVTVTYSETMDTDVAPVIAIGSGLTTIRSQSQTASLIADGGSWDGTGTIYTARYNVADDDFDARNVSVSVSGGRDVAGNSPQPTTQAAAFSLDTANPTAASIIVSQSQLLAGSPTATVSITFNEPTVGFDVSDLITTDVAGSNLSNGHGTFSNLTRIDDLHWTATLTAASDVQGGDDRVVIRGNSYLDQAENSNERSQTGYTIAIDTRRPTVTSIAVSDPTVTDADVATGTQVVTVNFSEDMDVDTAAATPVITFANAAGGTFVFQSGAWDGRQKYVATYSLADADVDATGVTVDVSGARDSYNNTMTPYTSTALFDVDTKNPTIAINAIEGNDIVNALEANDDIQISGTAAGAANQSVTITVAGAAGPFTTTTDSSGVWSLTVPVGSLPDSASIAVTAVVSDTNGNVSNTATRSFELDRTADSGNDLALTVASGNSLTNNNEKTAVAFTTAGIDTDIGDADATVTFTDVNGLEKTVLASAATADLSTLADGVITTRLNVTDNAGNTKEVMGADITLDTTADGGTAATLVVGDSLINNTEKTAVSYTVAGVDPDATVVVTFRDGAATVTGTLTGNGMSTVDLSSLSDGPITSSLAITDTAGNMASANGNGVTLDTTADAGADAKVTIDGDAYINSDEAEAVSFTIAGVDANTTATVTFVSTGGGTPVVVQNLSNGQQTVDLAGLADGTVTASIDVTDTAGNMATGASDTSVKDTMTPSTPIVNIRETSINSSEVYNVLFDLSGIDSDATATVTFTSSGGGNPIVKTGLINENFQTVDLSSLSDGTITATVVSMDQAGNRSSSNTDTATLDTDADIGNNASVVINDVDGFINNSEKTAVSYTLSGVDTDATATVTFSSSGGGQDVVISGLIDGQQSAVDLSDLADGTITASISVRDTAGNQVGGEEDTSIKDTVAPDAPTVVVTEDVNNDGYINAAELSGDIGVRVSLTGTNAAAGDALTVGSNAPITLTPDDIAAGGVDTTVASPAEGATLTVTAFVTDQAGNVGASASDSAVLDTTAPTIAIAATIAGDNVVNAAEDSAVVISGTTIGVENGRTVTVVLDDSSSATDAVTVTATVSNGAWTASAADIGALDNGTITVTANVSDAAGNPAAQADRTLTLDNVAPTAATGDITQDGDGIYKAGETVTFVANFGEAVTVGTGMDTPKLTLSNGQVATYTTTGSDLATGALAFTYTVVGGQDGTGVEVTGYTGTITDTAGNSALVTPTTDLAIVIDTVAPIAPSTPNLADSSDLGTRNVDNLTSDTTPTFTGTAESGATVTLYDGFNSIGSAVAASDGTWSFTTSTLGEGEHTIAAKATDVAGNTGDASDALTVTIDTTAPTVVSVAVSDGQITDTDVGGMPYTVTVTYSEAMNTAVAPAISSAAITDGTLTFTSGSWNTDKTVYTASYSVSDTNVEISSGNLNVSGGEDAAGNAAGSGSTMTGTAVDTLNPTATVDIVATMLNDADPVSNVTFTFSEAVAPGSVIATADHGTLSTLVFASDNKSATATFTATDDFDGQGSVTVTSFTDAAGNAGTSTPDTVTIDRVNPTATVDIVDTMLNDTDSTSNVTFTFSKAVDTGSVVATAEHGTLSTLVFASDNMSATATFAATEGFDGQGSVTVTSFTDAAGNAGTSTPDTVTIDRVNPTATVDIVDTMLNDTYPVSNVTFTFSEAVAPGSVIATADHGTLSTLVFASDNKSATATFTATDDFDGQGSVTVTSFTDAAGNAGTSTPDTVTIDRVNPTVLTIAVNDTLLSEADATATQPHFTVTVTYDSAMDTAVAPAIAFANPSATGLTLAGGIWSADKTVYTASYTVTDTNLEATGIDINVSGGRDLAGNSQVSVTRTDAFSIDTTAPTAPTVDLKSDTGVGTAFPASTSTTDNVTSDSTPSFTISGVEAGSTVELFVNDGTTTRSLGAPVPVNATTSTYTVPAGSELAAGSYSFTAKVTDAAGNVSVVGDATLGGTNGRLDIDIDFTGTNSNDTIVGSASADVIIGNNGADSLSAGDGNDEISGGAGIDTIDGGAGNDDIDGGSGNDVITGGGGDDDIIGGVGSDTAVFSGNVSGYTVSFNSGVVTVRDNTPGRDGTDTLTEVETLRFNGVNYSVANDAPVAVADANMVKEAGIKPDNTTEAGNPAAAGNVLTNDADLDSDLGDTKAVSAVNGQPGNIGVTVLGTYGSIVIGADGTYAYTLDNTRSATNSLKATDTGTETFTYTVRDAQGATSSSTLTITVTGTNDRPVLTAENAGTLTDTAAADSFAALTGQLDGTDAENDTLTYALDSSQSSTGTYGELTVDGAGTYRYVADANKVNALAAGTFTDTFNVKVSDGNGGVATTTLTVTINGANDAAVIAGTTTGIVAEAGGVANATPGTATATGTLTATDVDSAATFQPVAANTASIGGYGSYAVTTGGMWTYTLDNANATVQALTTTSAPLTDTFVVRSADGTAQTVSITINGANDVAVFTGADTGTVIEAGGINNGSAGIAIASGDLNASDVDNPADTFTMVSNVRSTGGFGTYSVSSSGVWTYTLDNADATVQALNAGVTLTDHITLTSIDSTTHVVTVTINGSNDAAVISGPASGIVVEAGGVSNVVAGTPTVLGDLTATDVDNPADSFQTVTTAATSAQGFGTYTVSSSGVWSYMLGNANAAVQALNVGGTLSDSFVVSSADGTTQTVSITIQGANDAAIVSADTRSLTETNAASSISSSGTLTVTDPDSAQTFVTQSATPGTYGTFAINAAGAWTYTANSAHNEFVDGLIYTDTFAVASADGTPTSVTINILGTNDAAVIAGTTTGTVAEAGGVANATPGTATGTLTATDVDSAATFQSVTTAATSAQGFGTYMVSSSGMWTYTLDDANATVQALTTTSAPLTDTFTVLTADGTSQLVTVTITGANDAAVIAGTTTGTVAEAGGVANATPGTATATGTLTATDVDSAATFQPVAANTASIGGYGSYAVTTGGVWTYTLDDANATVQALTTTSAPLTDTFTVLTADGTSQLVTVTITGANDAAVIAGTTTGTVAEAGGVANATPGTATATGTLTATDVDSAATFQSVAANTASIGGYGSYAVTTGGVWTYTLDDANATVQALTTTSAPLTDTFTVLTADGTSQLVTVTINGANDAPTVAAPLTSTAAEGAASYTLNLLSGTADVDSGDVLSVTGVTYKVNGGTAASIAPTGVSLSGSTLTVDPTNAAFNSLGVGQSQQIVVSYNVADSHGGTVAQSETITISGSNDSPLGVSDAAALAQRTTTTGNVLANDSDADTGDQLLVGQISHGTASATATSAGIQLAGDYGTVTIKTDGSYSYTANREGTLAVGAVATDVFTYSVVDAHNGSATSQLTFSVTGSAQGDNNDNIIIAASGNNTLSGGAGDDTVVLGFKLTDASISYDTTGRTILDGPNGSHNVLSGFEHFQFTDGTVNENTGSVLVDDLYYYVTNKDIWTAHADPEAHYNQFGWHEGRNPNAEFSTTGYLAANPDVASAGINPLLHYDAFGWKEGRDPSANFDNELYLARNPDVKAAGVDPLAHYLTVGQAQGRQAYAAVGKASDLNVHPGFDAEFYLLSNPDVAKSALAAGGDTFAFAYQHYQNIGWRDGLNPNAIFDTKGYLAAYADVKAGNIDPLAHYHAFGFTEGRDPSINFDTKAYEAANADVRTAGIDPMEHYLQFGQLEGRGAFADGKFG